MSILSPTRSLQDLVFDEARGLVLDRMVSVFDGLYRVGKHCSVTASATPLGGKGWRIQFEFRAFEPELIDWSWLRIIVLDASRGERIARQLLPSGTTEQAITFESFSLKVSRGLQTIDAATEFAVRRPELLRISVAASVEEILLPGPEGQLPRHFRSTELGLDLWILQYGDEIHVVVATAKDLRSDLQSKDLKLLLIRETTGEVLPPLQVSALEYRSEIREIPRFPLGELRGKPGWFRYEQYRIPIDEDFYIDLIEA